MKRLRSTIPLIAFFCLSFLSAGTPQDWENPAIYERNQTPPHVPLMPFKTVREALLNKRKESAFCLLLNGSWSFKWVSTPDEAPREFYNPEADVRSWDEIQVPGNWQMQGFGHPLFRNVRQPFPSTPPKVPSEYNPVGSYRRAFAIPDSWEDRQIFLHFEGVKSASYVWVNGWEVGYNQGGMEPAEYDITPFVRPGTNILAVQVYRFSDGTYLEDQDMWRLSGIYRDVYLMATPKVHIRDFFITTDLDREYRDATLKVEAEVENYGTEALKDAKARISLYEGRDPDSARILVADEDFTVAPGDVSSVTLSGKVTDPEKWSAERPHLYSLTLELIAPTGKVEEILSSRVGFREVEVKNQAVYVNGVPIKFNAVNSHVHHPVTGRAMDIDTMHKDLRLMKQFNINSVRTSHYPPNVEYLDLADEYGIYIIDEAGTEAHATTYLSSRPEWKSAYIDRGRKMVKRDRNHPSIVIWSAGNESGSGENICALIAEGKRIDPSRAAWLYGGNNDYLPDNDPLDCEDIVGPRYPTPFELKTRIAMVPESVDARPSFMDEYVAVTGNAGGALDEFWEVIRKYPRTIGGAIWDWVSPGISWPWVTTPDQSRFQNDGTLMGRARLVEGKFGQALELSGHDEWVEIYRDPSLDITGEALTLEAWVLPDSWNGTGSFITKGDHQYGLQQKSEDTLEFYLFTSVRASVEAPIPDDWEHNWHHLAGIYDGSHLKLYLDGRIVVSKPHTGRISNTPFPVNIGRNAALHGQEHPGYLSNATMDQVRIYNRALSVQELDQLSPDPRDTALLWLDFETTEVKDEYFSLGIGGRSYGLIWPDRTVQPELWQLKKSAQPVEAQEVNLEQGEVRILNHFHFTDLKDLNAGWAVYSDGQLVQEGKLEIELGPLKHKVIRIPYALAPLASDFPKTRHLLIQFTLPDETIWADKGHEVAWAQFELPVPQESNETPRNELAPLDMKETEQALTISGEGFSYTFDKDTGSLSSIKFQDRELLQKGPQANVWRAPLANELDAWSVPRAVVTNRRQEMGNNIAAGWYSAGLDRLRNTVEAFTVRQMSNQVIRVEIASHEVPEPDRLDAYSTGLENTFTFDVFPSGDLVLRHRVKAEGLMPDWLPKIGLQMILPPEFDQLSWYGRGPHESYPDRKSGARIGLFQSSVQEQFQPYLIPQDYGNKSDVYWISLTDENGMGLFASGTGLLNVSTQHTDPDNLSRALYPFQLRAGNGITLNLDHRVSGVGGTAISVLNKYRVSPGEFEYAVRLRPYKSSEVEPMQLFRERLPKGNLPKAP